MKKLTLGISIITMLFSVTLFAQNSGVKKHRKSKTSTSSSKTKKISSVEEVLSSVDGRTRKLRGDDKEKRDYAQTKGEVVASRKIKEGEQTPSEIDSPHESTLKRAKSFDGDLRKIPYRKPVVREEEVEREAPYADEVFEGDPVPLGSARPSAPSVAAPSPLLTFQGLDFATFGAGRPPDTDGDVGPNHFIQGVNSSIGIYRKSDGVRLVGLSLNSFMSAGSFGNLCDTNNFGDPVILYDSFEDRWIVTDFAFTIDGSGNVTSNSFQCFAVSKTGDPVAGGWNFYSTVETDFLGDYPKFGVWTDGIYMTANEFGKTAGGSFQTVRARALNKAQMYAGLPTVQTVTFDIGGGEFTVLPANARLQTGTPPAGSPNYMAVVANFTNAISFYRFRVDWNRISTSTITGPFISLAPASWASAPSTVPAMGSTSNRDTLPTRLMVQNQYTNIGGVESLWNSHTVRGSTTTQSAVRYYQVNVTGGTVAATTTQAATHNPDTTNRFIPSLAVDKDGNMLLGYSASSATLFPAIRYAGRLAADPVNTLPQTENSLIEGTGSEVSGTSTRWGDYSTMTLDPNGCTFWQTHEYYAVTGNNWQTRIGSIVYPSCVPLLNNGVLQGTVTSAVTGLPINGATVNFGNRTATTNASGFYSFSALPQGTYLAENASATGYNSASASNLVVTDGSTTTQNFSLGTSVASACLTDTTQSDFQTGVSSNVDLNASVGDVTLTAPVNIDQQNTSLGTSGVGISITNWSGQTFTPAITGQLTRADINLFCSTCTGTTPNLTLSLRATSGGLPVGADLATATIPGFSSGASAYYTGTFSSPPTLTAGTQYALVIRPTANPSLGTYAITRSGSSTTGTSTYAGGDRLLGATSGTVWSIPLSGSITPGVTDAGFRTYINAGFASSGNLTSSIKDSSPVASNTTNWTMLTWTASTPSGTSVRFQVAGSNNPNGPFNFVGPGGTAATFFTTSGASLSQFNGLRYLQYRAFLTTPSSAATPTLSDVMVCYTNPRVWTGAVSSDWNDPANWSSSGVPGSVDRAIIPVSGVVNNPVNTTPNTVGSLQLDSGIIDTGTNSLTVTTCSPSAVTGGSATSFVRGTLTRCVDSAGVYAFPVGTANGYSPASLNNVVGTGNFTVAPAQTTLAGTSPTLSLTKNWDLSPGVGVTQADVTLNYLDADVPGTANENNFNFIRRSGTVNTAFTPSSRNVATNTATLNGVNAFSIWSLGINAPTAASVAVSGRVLTSTGRGIPKIQVVATDFNGNVRIARTNGFGIYRFGDLQAGQNYVFSVTTKRYEFADNARSLFVGEDTDGVDFTALP